MSRGYAQEEHTADLALSLWGESQSELFLAGLEGIIDQLAGGDPPAPRSVRRIRLHALDREDLLVRWLNEILHLAVAEGFLCAAANIEIDETTLEAELRGEEDASERLRCELKAATYHDLRLREEAGVWRCRVVIDV